ncbi:hypothetical protein IMW75_03335 [Pseudomonas gregormendelii]|uniref:Uncharacterized protein n=1 Tax=Pseudomonas gregormendelii TaxID=1628277 RepID=A0ABS3AAV5_9PSED|nr:hypothetical protein [Pseudomonas gregormendelii]MBN3964318.1 hypothetical protein [Pseudomonas gregormendelii]
MLEPYNWEVLPSDIRAATNGSAVAEYLAHVVMPSIAALEQRRHDLALADDPGSKFALADHPQLVKRTHKTFCLAIHSLYEQQLRSYLHLCTWDYPVESVTRRHQLEKSTWGKELNALFFKVRGLKLDGFASYPVLTQLNLMANACRHGEGSSARSLYEAHPELWPSIKRFQWEDELPKMLSFQSLEITLEQLAQYADAISLFWLDLQCQRIEDFADEPSAYVSFLREKRVSLLASVTRSPRI